MASNIENVVSAGKNLMAQKLKNYPENTRRYKS